MKDWEIRKLICFTVDNASYNDTPIKWLKPNITMTEDIVRGNKFTHV